MLLREGRGKQAIAGIHQPMRWYWFGLFSGTHPECSNILLTILLARLPWFIFSGFFSSNRLVVLLRVLRFVGLFSLTLSSKLPLLTLRLLHWLFTPRFNGSCSLDWLPVSSPKDANFWDWTNCACVLLGFTLANKFTYCYLLSVKYWY
jgi:hypothetical protein